MANKWISLSPTEVVALKDAINRYPAKLRKNLKTLNKFYSKLTRTETPIKVSSRKGKGRNLQHWVAEKIADITGFYYDQQNDQCLIHTREMGQAGVDIILRGEAQKLFPYSPECKNSESFSFADTIKQAKVNQAEGTDWLIIHKRKCLTNPIAIMDWDTFEKLAAFWIKCKYGDCE